MWTSLHSRTMQDSAVKPCSVKCGMGGAEGCHNTGELTHLGERDSYPYKRGLDRKVGAPSCDKVPLLSQHPFEANFLPFPTNWHPLSHLSEYNLVQLCGDVVILEHAGSGGSPGRYVLKIHFFIESGLKMIQFKTKSRIFIQKNIHSIEYRIFTINIHSKEFKENYSKFQ